MAVTDYFDPEKYEAAMARAEAEIDCRTPTHPIQCSPIMTTEKRTVELEQEVALLRQEVSLLIKGFSYLAGVRHE